MKIALDLCSAYAPKLLPVGEPFLFRGISCPGCGQALAVRLIGKAIGHRGRFPYGDVMPMPWCSALPFSNWQRFQGSPITKTDRNKKSVKNIRAVVVDSGLLRDIMPMLDNTKKVHTPLLVVCCFNEAGIRRHCSEQDTILRTETILDYRTRREQIQEVLETVRRMKLPFMATATTAHPFDLIQKVIQGLDCNGPAFLGLFTSCPTGCRYPSASARQAMLRAVKSGFFPLFTVRGKVVTLQTPTERLLPVKHYFRLHHAYLYTTPEEIAAVQKRIDEYMAVLSDAAKSGDPSPSE